MTGDGDSLSIGGNHLIHALRRNVPVKILLFNNQIYGLTKGQASPTSELGKITKSTPFGVADHPFNPVALALGAEATFVARTIDRDRHHLTEVLSAAARHEGAALVEIYQNCPVFNDGAFAALTEKDVKDDNQIRLEHGKPVRFGPNGERGVARAASGGLEIIDVTEPATSELLIARLAPQRSRPGVLACQARRGPNGPDPDRDLPRCRAPGLRSFGERASSSRHPTRSYRSCCSPATPGRSRSRKAPRAGVTPSRPPLRRGVRRLSRSVRPSGPPQRQAQRSAPPRPHAPRSGPPRRPPGPKTGRPQPTEPAHQDASLRSE